MRLGKKKEKDRETEKEQCIDSVARLICAPKQHLAPLRGKYDYFFFTLKNNVCGCMIISNMWILFTFQSI